MWKTRSHFEQRLMARGFKTIGSGLFARVFAKPGSNKVIKVGPLADGWPAYIGWAKQHGWLGKFAPNVTSFRVIRTSSDKAWDKGFYVAVMERLGATIGHLRGEGSKSKHLRTWEALQSRPYSYEFAKDADLKERVPEWAPFVKDFRKFHDRNKNILRYDMHPGNWMVSKGSRRLVLTDPFTMRGGENTDKFSTSAAEVFARGKGRAKQLSLAL